MGASAAVFAEEAESLAPASSSGTLSPVSTSSPSQAVPAARAAWLLLLGAKCSRGSTALLQGHHAALAYGSPLFLQAELSLQKEQLQLKIIEVEDEVDKWQKERDRIKVRGGYSLFRLPYACLFLFQSLTSLFLPSIFLAYPALTHSVPYLASTSSLSNTHSHHILATTTPTEVILQHILQETRGACTALL